MGNVVELDIVKKHINLDKGKITQLRNEICNLKKQNEYLLGEVKRLMKDIEFIEAN